MNELIAWWNHSESGFRFLTITLLVALLIQLFYHLYFFVRPGLYRHQTTNGHPGPVSVVICAKNEERRLRDLVPLLMEQNYPDFELVVVDDSSWDDTITTLRAYQVRYPKLHVIKLDEDYQRMRGKKFALTMGIKGAKNDLLLLTDADCIPAGKDWITRMMTPFNDPQIGIVLGISPYAKTSGLLNRLIRYDAAQIALTYIGFALRKVPYMGVGRNLAYRKQLFLANSGFKSHLSLPSGDDDLFISEVATKQNCAVVLDPEAQTFSAAKTTWSEWFHQKRRHYTTSSRYRIGVQLGLSLWPVSFLLLWASAAGLVLLHNAFLIAGATLFIRYVAHLATFSVSFKRIGQADLIPWSPMLEGALWLIQPLLGLWNLLSKPKQWK